MVDQPDPSEPRPVADCCGPGRGRDTDPDLPHARIARHFDQLVSTADTDGFAAPARVSLRLAQVLADAAELHPSVLDLGCGAGRNAIRLLDAGASSVTGIDLSPTSIEVARRQAAASGFGPERASFLVGNAAEMTAPRHDWVLLDRAICCYGDGEGLLAHAVAAAGKRIALTVPESRGLRGLVNRATWPPENLCRAMFQANACTGYVHDIRALHRVLAAAGFHPLHQGHSRLWYYAVFERPA